MGNIFERVCAALIPCATVFASCGNPGSPDEALQRMLSALEESEVDSSTLVAAILEGMEEPLSLADVDLPDVSSLPEGRIAIASVMVDMESSPILRRLAAALDKEGSSASNVSVSIHATGFRSASIKSTFEPIASLERGFYHADISIFLDGDRDAFKTQADLHPSQFHGVYWVGDDMWIYHTGLNGGR